MKLKSILVAAFLALTTSLFALDVTVEQVLDVPPNPFGTFSGSDDAAYASNGQLLLAFNYGFNLFVLEDEQWRPLIDSYKTPEYQRQQEQDRYRGVVHLYNSKTPGEFLYYVRQTPIPKEHYRIFVDQRGEIQAEWVTQDYYENNIFFDPQLGYMIGQDNTLRNGLKISLTPLEKGLQSYWPDIVDCDGNRIYRFTDAFSDAFVDNPSSVSTNYERDRVAMVISFTEEVEGDFATMRTIRHQKLVIFKLYYDK